VEADQSGARVSSIIFCYPKDSMQNSYTRTIMWLLGLQWRISPFFFIWRIFYSSFSGVTAILFAYIGAQVLVSVTEVALQGGAVSTVYWWLAAALALELVRIALQTINGVVSHWFSNKVEIVADRDFMLKMYTLSQEQFANEAFNSKISRASSRLWSLQNALNEITSTSSSFIEFISALIAIMIVSPIAGIVIAVIAIPVALVQVHSNTIMDKVYDRVESDTRIAFRTRWLLMDPVTMPEVRLVNGFKKLLRTWQSFMEKKNKVIFSARKKLLWVDVVTDIVDPVYVATANIYFLQLLVRGAFSLDQFFFLRTLLSQISASTGSLIRSAKYVHQLILNLENFSEVFHTAPAIPDGSKKVQSPLTIEFKNVSFKYPDTDTNILSDISFRITPGNKLAIVGENGAGKSTLIKLLLRQYLPTQGVITVNDTDIRDIEIETYYTALGVLSQEFLLPDHMTIRENLLLGLSNGISDDDLWQALKLVGVENFVRALPHQLDQRLDPSFQEGTGLSGGQRQRLGVARVLLRQSDLIILDEPTSAIDAKGEYEVFNNIYKTHEGKSTLIVSHRFSTVRKAQCIIVLQGGTITEHGSHEQLIAHGGLYKEMFEVQAEGYR